MEGRKTRGNDTKEKINMPFISYYNANKKKLRNKVSSELEGFRRSK